MQCPNCSSSMQEVQKSNVDIDYCPVCKGIWLDRGELDKIVDTQNKFEEQHYQRYHHDKRYDDDDDDYYSSRKKRRKGFLGDLFDFD